MGSQAAQIETNAWIRNWANAVEAARANVTRQSVQLVLAIAAQFGITSDDDSLYYVVVYALLNILFGLLVAGRTHATFRASLRASRVLYEQILKAVLNARMR